MAFTKEETTSIVTGCNASSTRESVSKILAMDKSRIVAILAEFEGGRADIRFGDNLLSACNIISKMTRDNNYYELFLY